MVRSSLLRATFWLACIVVAALSMTPTEYLTLGIFTWWDKAQHALTFFVLGGLGLIAYRNYWWWVVVGLLVFGGAIELAQDASGWRNGEWADWLADAVGLVSSVSVLALLRSRSDAAWK